MIRASSGFSATAVRLVMSKWLFIVTVFTTHPVEFAVTN